MRSPIFGTFVLAALGVCLSFGFAPAARGVDLFTTITLPTGSNSFAANSETGAVAIVDAAGLLTLYPKLLRDGTLDGAIKEKAATAFDAVIYKRVAGAKSGYFLAASSSEKTLSVFDDATLAQVKSIPMQTTGPLTLAASTSERDPYVVCGNGVHPDGVRRINIRTLTDEGKIAFAEMMSRPDEIALSADGSLLYSRAANVSPTGVRCWQILPGKQPGEGFVATLRHSEHASRPMYVPDAVGQFVACGPTLFSADMSKIVGEMPAAPACFHPTRPFFFGFSGDNLLAVSLNTFKEVSRLELTGEALERVDRGRRFTRLEFRPGHPNSIKPVILLDARHHNLLVCYDTKLVLVPESALHLPDEPSLYATLDGAQSIAVGQPLQLKIHKLDPRARMELESGPAGLKLVSEQFVWTPTVESVGTAKVRVKLSAGGTERIQDVELSVRQTFVTLPFAPDEVRVSTDGDLALMLQYTSARQRNNGRFPGNGEEPYCRIALVRLNDPKTAPRGPAAAAVNYPTVIAERTLSANVVQRWAAVDDTFVYLPLQDSDAFLVLSSKDLTDVKRLFTPGRIQAMNSAGGRLYLACNQNTFPGIPSSGKVVFKIPELDPISVPKQPAQFRGNYNVVSEVPVLQDGGLLYDQVLYDSTMTHPRLLVGTEGFAASEAVHGGNNAQRFNNYGQQGGVAFWGTMLQGFSLQRVGGQMVGQISVGNQNGYPGNSGTQIVLLPNVPAAAALEVSMKQSGNRVEGDGMRERGEVSFFDLVTGTKAGSVVLMDEPTARNPYNGGNPNTGLVVPTPSALVVTIGERFFLLNTSGSNGAIDFAKLPMPLHFVNQQSAFAFASDKTLVLSHIVQGGTLPLEFTLSSEAPGVDIDKTTGKITLDGKLLAPRALEDLYTTIHNQYRFMASATSQPSGYAHENQPQSFAMGLAEYMKIAGPRFQALTGRPPTGTPVALSLGLIARDKNQQTASLNEAVLLEIPTPALIAHAKNAEAEEQKVMAGQQLLQQQQQAEWQARQFDPQRRRPGRVSATQPAGNESDAQGRIAELEQENAILRAKVDMLSDLIRNGAVAPIRRPTTRPNGD